MRLWRHSKQVGECFEWQATKSPKGYGYISYRGKTQRVHRLAYHEFRGPIPEGMELDHLCGNKACWNPAHLEVVTHNENMRRTRGRKRPLKTHCKHGHEFTPATTYIRKDDGTRQCRLCSRDRDRIRKPLNPPNTCKKGLHEMTSENTKITTRGTRLCRACARRHYGSRLSGWERQRQREYARANARALLRVDLGS